MNTEQMKPSLTGIRMIGTPGCGAGAECDGTGCIPVIAGGGAGRNWLQISERKVPGTPVKMEHSN